MKRVMMTILLIVLVFQAVTGQKVQNVIILIGDGMGVSHVYAGLTANKGSLDLERSQYVGFSKTYSAGNYITDSAAGGTAIACGVKTTNGTIGLDANGKSVPSILEVAAKNGQSTGVVVACALTHATPASFVAHQASRNMVEEIANDYLNSGVTVCIGGGRKDFEQRKDGRNITSEMKAKGYQVAYSMDDVAKVKSGKLLGLVAEDHPAAYPERGNMLPDAVSAALDILKNNERGFVLMVEGSQIDWAAHSNNQEQVVNEMLDFDRTIKVAFDFADKNPNTLVVITADHETGGLSLIGGDIATGDLQTAFSTGGHSAVMVPVFAYGTRANEFAGIYQNTDIKPKIVRLVNGY